MRTPLHGRRQLTQGDLELMMLPDRLWKTKVQEVDVSVRSTIENYLREFDEAARDGAGFFLLGESGVGKSSIGALIGKEARARGYTVLFVSVFDLRELVRTRTSFDEGVTMMDRCRSVDVLILDSFQETDLNDQLFGARSLEELLSTRSAHKRISVVTTRMNLKAMEKADLLASTAGSMILLTVKGPNRHEKQGEDLRRKFVKESP